MTPTSTPMSINSMIGIDMNIIERIKRTNVLRNVWTQMAQITLICGLLVLYATNNSGEHCGLYFVGFAAMVGIAVVFVVWLFWFLYVVWSKRHLAPMALKGYKILDSIDFILFCYWILCWFFPVLIQPWCISIIEAVWIASAVIAYKFRKELL